MRVNHQDHAISDLLRKCSMKEHRMRILTRMDNFNGENKVKHFVVKVYRTDFYRENRDLLNEISLYMTKDKKDPSDLIRSKMLKMHDTSEICSSTKENKREDEFCKLDFENN